MGLILPSFSRKGVYAANAVDLNGSNTYLSRGADLSGISDGKELTVSLWFRLDGADSSRISFLAFDSVTWSIFRHEGNTIRASMATSGGSGNLTLISSSTYTSSATWHHLLIAADLANSVADIYVDDADDENGAQTVTANSNMDFTRGDFTIGSFVGGGNLFNGCMADVWLDTTYIDITQESNRRLFIDADGKPVNLGSDGSGPTGSQPVVFCSGETASWHTNKGSGGGFTENGALTDCSSSPSD